MKRARTGVTIIELVVVVLILALLATVATPVLVGQVTRAKVAVTADTIRQLEIAIVRYEIDLGEFPPSGTIAGVLPYGENWGNGYLMEALLHSSGGDVNAPSSPRWAGPYIQVSERYLRVPGVNGVPSLPFVNARRSTLLMDPFESPYHYYRYTDYETFVATRLPVGHPFRNTETWYNPRTVQIWSAGPDGITRTPLDQRGLDSDDVNNF